MGFSITNQPAIGVPPWLWKPPYGEFPIAMICGGYFAGIDMAWSEGIYRKVKSSGERHHFPHHEVSIENGVPIFKEPYGHILIYH